MKVYLVGGAVRDQLMGRPVQDRDWVVVGASPEEMGEAGFRPVGADFPVFLHPETNEKYALARTERKTAPGYGGFVFHTDREVTLEEDLARRDLTINAVAQDAEGRLVDPHGGVRDVQDKIFRHVGESFAEDPVRILRVARLAARYPDFTIDPGTMGLMRRMVDNGEVDALVPERVWKEVSRGLMEDRPSRLLEVLRDCGALERLLPELHALIGVEQPAAHHPEICTFKHVCLVLEQSALLKAPLPVRYACLMHDLGKGTTDKALLPKHHAHEIRSAELAEVVSRRLKVPSECRELAVVVAKEHGNIHASMGFKSTPVVRLFERCDAFRQSGRFKAALMACECDARGRTGLEDRDYPQVERLTAALEQALSVDTRAVSKEAMAAGRIGPEIGEMIRLARIHAIAALEFRPKAPRPR